MSKSELYQRPLRLVCNRLYRGYPGGREIDRFRGVACPADDDCPEAWVGSTTYTAYQRQGICDPDYGFAEVIIENGEKTYLRNIINKDPSNFLGKSHATRYNADTGVLVKLLDTQRQLGLQTHPDRDFARKFFDSDYGKTESWYILDTRKDQDEVPYVLLGFKEGITREKFQEFFLKGDIDSMEACCHKIPVFPGDMFLVDAGVPHAIGPGCFMVEVQEPSCVGVGARMSHFENPDDEKAYIEKTMGCYHYTGRSYDENLKLYKIDPCILNKTAGGTEVLLLGSSQTSFFAITRIDTDKEFNEKSRGSFTIAIIIEGEGKLITDNCNMTVKKGDELFLPAGVGNILWKSSETNLSIVKAFPPDLQW